MSSWELYTEDDSTVSVEFMRKETYRISCSCGWETCRRTGGDGANRIASAHVLEHDAAQEWEDDEQ